MINLFGVAGPEHHVEIDYQPQKSRMCIQESRWTGKSCVGLARQKTQRNQELYIQLSRMILLRFGPEMHILGVLANAHFL